MGFMSTLVFGIPIWMISLLVLSIVFVVYVLLFASSSSNTIEKIKGLILKKRFPEKVIKVIIHYKTGLYQVFWRVIPLDCTIKIKKQTYIFNIDDIIKPTKVFTDDKAPIPLEGQEDIYVFDHKAVIKEKKEKYPEIHYMYNVPHPLEFDVDHEDVKLSSSSLKAFKENDLFEKLLRLKGDKGVTSMLLFLVMVNTLVSAAVLAKMMGWI